ncbi:hypothetical protein [Brevundimonas sp.]|uniref:hypothetical protein n=1 Tax=Brevundimonas sp. TaxID=1871086 RepID=UPI002FC7887D
MTRLRDEAAPALLELETWDVPFRLSADDLYLEAGADRRAGGRPPDDQEDDR